MKKTLAKRTHALSVIPAQRRIIDDESAIPSFSSHLEDAGRQPLRAVPIQTLQINLGKMCNQVCGHCHVDAGPDRKEIMTRETMEACLQALSRTEAQIVDLTGGAPEMNPEFRWFVDRIRDLDRHVIDRSNLTILVTPGYENLPEFLADRQVEVTASLPYYLEKQTDAQRGDHVFERSIQALERLNKLGYGDPDSGLVLNLVYNPVGAFLPPAQAGLELEYKRELKRRHGIVFNRLYTITNIPINRFLEWLIESGNYGRYMQRLHAGFNPEAVDNVMCRSTVSVGWDGRLYDCDFNQMLELPLAEGAPVHIRDFDVDSLSRRAIQTGNHCYACTAGGGSSCTGAVL